MNKPYTCHLCAEGFDAYPDGTKAEYDPMELTVFLVRCPGCSEVYAVDIAGDAELIPAAGDTSFDVELLDG